MTQEPLVVIELHRGYTVTKFRDGLEVCALHTEQEGQAETAKFLRMSIQEMNESHDIVHSCLANWLGLDYSPALRCAAQGRSGGELEDIEEAAVLALQRYIAALMRSKMQ